MANLTKLEKREQRKDTFPYTKGEEIFNAVTHIVGASFALVATILMIIKTWGQTLPMISSLIYGSCMLILFIMSAIYHFLRKNRAKKVFQILDHCSIFLLIAGTYTPFCLVTFYDSLIGILMFSIVWVVSILGIVLNAINMKNKAVMIFSQISYIALGWCVISVISPLVKILPIGGFIWLLMGGIFYTLGVIFFAFGRKIPYFHSIWHLFVFFGALTQFISVFFFVL